MCLPVKKKKAVEFYSKAKPVNILLLLQTEIFVSFLFSHLIITEERELRYSDVFTGACLRLSAKRSWGFANCNQEVKKEPSSEDISEYFVYGGN